MSADTVKIKAAAATFQPAEDVNNDSVLLSMSTADGVSIEFELDLMAVAVLALTLQPALIAAKTRVDSRG